MKKNFLLIIVIFLNFLNLNAQNKDLDSLENLLKNHQKEDTIKVIFW